MNILEELWDGNLDPSSREEYRCGDYRDLVLLYQRNEERLVPTLNDTQKTDLKKLQDLTEEMQGVVQCNAFIVGFRLAVQLMTASLGTTEA